MSPPSSSVAVTGAPTGCPAAVFSATDRDVLAWMTPFPSSNTGASFPSPTVILTVCVASAVVSALPESSFPSCTDTVTE